MKEQNFRQNVSLESITENIIADIAEESCQANKGGFKERNKE